MKNPERKRNQVPPPAFPALAGEAVFNYTNHDGRALIGDGETVFETQWSNSGNSSIHVYNDPAGILGVAIAPEVNSLSEITTATVSGLDYTSRTRTPREGQIVVFENIYKRFLAAKVIDVLATSHGDDENRLVLNYAVIPTNENDLQITEILSLSKVAEDSLVSLKSNTNTLDVTHGQIGHNNPPEPIPLDSDELNETVLALKVIRQEVAHDKPNKAKIENYKKDLFEKSQKIINWVGRKCDLAADEFAKQLGRSLGDAKFLAAAWLALSGRLDQLLAALSVWLPSI